MGKRFTFAVSIVGSAALVGSVLSTALASQPPPLHTFARSGAKHFSVNGSLTVTDVLKANKNLNVYGNSYLRGKAEIYKSLLVRKGGIKADSLDITGPAQAQSLTVAGSLQAGTIAGSSLALTGAATVGGAVTSSGKVTGNGVDAGAGGLTTSGTLTAGGATVTSLTDSGALTAASINSSGAITANGMTVTGNVNFTGATVTGLSSGLPSSIASLTIGSAGSSANPLTLSANNKTASIGVNSSGALTVPDLAVTGSLTLAGNFAVSGTGGLTTSVVTAPITSGTTQGTLTLQGSGITLNGNTTLNNGSDLTMSTSGALASHIVANGDKDVAGTVSVNIPVSTSAGGDLTAAVTFAKPYAQQPVIVLTPLNDPEPGSAAPPKYFVTITQGSSSSQYTGFTVHVSPAAAVGTAYTAFFGYHVHGS